MAHDDRGVEQRPVPALRTSARAAMVSAAACAVVLTGWAFDVPILKSLMPGRVATRPWGAVTFLTLSFAVYALAWQSRRNRPTRLVRTAARIAAACAGTIAGLTFLQYAMSVNLGFDAWLFHTQVMRDGVVFPGRMAQVTAFAATLIAAGVWCAGSPTESIRRTAPAFVLISSAIGLLGLAGSLFGADTVYSLDGFSSVSLPSAMLIFTLSLSTLALQPDSFVVAPLLSRHSGGVLARRLLPAALILPFVVGWIRVYGEVHGLYSSRVGLTLSACVNTSIFAVLAWITARHMNRLDEVSEASDHAARAAISESENRYRTLAESLPQLVFTCRSDGWCDYVSPQWVAYTGVPASEQLGSRWSEQLHPDDLAGIAAQWSWSVISGESLDVELRIRRHDGVYCWFRTMAVPVRDASGEVTKWFGSHTDIHDRKQAEAGLQELTSALEQRVEERTAQLKAAKEQAESADRLKTDFITTMSHELRTPLNSIIGFTGTLLTRLPGPLNTAQEQQLRIIQTSGRNLLMLINDVLDVARIESGGATDYTVTEVDVLQLLRGTAAEQLSLAESKGLFIEISLNVETLVVKTDERALRQVLANLINNAIKFTQRGTISISASSATVRGTERFEIAICDTGIGIAPQDMARLFMKFSRLHEAQHSVAGGTGLGLYLCQLIADRLGMSIEVESELGKGSCFTVCIPATMAHRASQ